MVDQLFRKLEVKSEYPGLAYFRDKKIIVRVLEFDPVVLLQSEKVLSLNMYSRKHKLIIADLFPKQDGICACGCGRELPKRRRVWYTDTCMTFGYYVYCVIANRTNIIDRLLSSYYDDCCMMCGETGVPLDIDHIIPVCKGGGVGWLSNYQFLCKSCHKEKTLLDMAGLRR